MWITEPPENGDLASGLRRFLPRLFAAGGLYLEAVIFAYYWTLKHCEDTRLAILDIVDRYVFEAYENDRKLRPENHVNGDMGRPGIAVGYAGLTDEGIGFPEMKPEYFGEEFGGPVFGVSRAIQAHPLIAAHILTSAMTMCVHDRVKFAQGHGIPGSTISVNTLLGSDTGSRKSSCAEVIFEAINAWQADQVGIFSKIITEALDNNTNRDVEMDTVRKELKAGQLTPEKADMAIAEIRKRVQRVPEVPRKKIDNYTMEKALKHLAGQPTNATSIVSMEGQQAQTLAGYYKDGQCDTGLINSGFSGESAESGRVTTGVVYMPQTHVSINQIVQPVVIGKLFKKDVLKLNGFLARCLIAVIPGEHNARKFAIDPKTGDPVDTTVPSACSAALQARLDRLLGIPEPQKVSASGEGPSSQLSGVNGYFYSAFTEAARGLYNDYNQEMLDKERGAHAQFPGFAARIPNITLRFATNLQWYKTPPDWRKDPESGDVYDARTAELIDDSFRMPITADTLREAIYFIQLHVATLRAATLMYGGDSALSEEEEVLQVIRSLAAESEDGWVTKTRLRQYFNARLKGKKSFLNDALATLLGDDAAIEERPDNEPARPGPKKRGAKPKSYRPIDRG
jgi:hypothetical protein